MELELLLRAVRDGNKDALNTLTALLLAQLPAYFRSRRLPEDVAEDLTHDTVMIVINELPGLAKKPRSLRAWLFKTARNRVLSYSRKEYKRHMTTARHADELAALDRSLSSRLNLADDVAVLDRGLQEMPDHMREVVEHCLAEGDPAEFTARKGLAVATFRSQKKRSFEWYRAFFEAFRRKF